MVVNTLIVNEGKLTKRGLRNMGDRIKFIIKKPFAMTFAEFANHCNVPTSTLYGWCNGIRPKNKEAFIRLINTYHINPNWLFYGKGHMFNEKGKPYFKK